MHSRESDLWREALHPPNFSTQNAVEIVRAFFVPDLHFVSKIVAAMAKAPLFALQNVNTQCQNSA